MIQFQAWSQRAFNILARKPQDPRQAVLWKGPRLGLTGPLTFWPASPRIRVQQFWDSITFMCQPWPGGSSQERSRPGRSDEQQLFHRIIESSSLAQVGGRGGSLEITMRLPPEISNSNTIPTGVASWPSKKLHNPLPVRYSCFRAAAKNDKDQCVPNTIAFRKRKIHRACILARSSFSFTLPHWNYQDIL